MQLLKLVISDYSILKEKGLAAGKGCHDGEFQKHNDTRQNKKLKKTRNCRSVIY